jgi:hypothetical protein
MQVQNTPTNICTPHSIFPLVLEQGGGSEIVLDSDSAHKEAPNSGRGQEDSRKGASPLCGM